MTLTRGRPDPSTYEISGAIGGSALNSVALNASGGRWVRWDDGTELDVVELAKSVIARLEQIFAQHAIATNA